jgi:hypothetical protein
MHYNELHKITDLRYGVFRKKSTMGVGVSVTVLWPKELHGAQSLITVSQPFKKFPTFYGNRSLFQSKPSRPISSRSVLISYSHLCYRSSEWFLSL